MIESDLTNVFDRDLAAFDRSLQKAAIPGAPSRGEAVDLSGRARRRRYFVVQFPFQVFPVRPSFYW